MGRVDPAHWLQSALSRTAIPFAVVTLLLVLAGALLQCYAPAATTLVEVIDAISGRG